MELEWRKGLPHPYKMRNWKEEHLKIKEMTALHTFIYSYSSFFCYSVFLRITSLFSGSGCFIPFWNIPWLLLPNNLFWVLTGGPSDSRWLNTCTRKWKIVSFSWLNCLCTYHLPGYNDLRWMKLLTSFPGPFCYPRARVKTFYENSAPFQKQEQGLVALNN